MDDVTKLSQQQVREKTQALLGGDTDDTALLRDLEELARSPRFGALTWFWGPQLYRRNRVFFRPFILSRFTTFEITSLFRIRVIEWKGEAGRALQEWLDEADRNDDIELFKRLYSWKLTRKWRLDDRTARRDLVNRYKDAPGAAHRALVLARFDLPFPLDEPAAMVLYEKDPKYSKPFIIKHIPSRWWVPDSPVLWEGLKKAAEDRGDRDLAMLLYRRQIPVARWKKDVLSLCDSISDSEALVAALKERHPEAWGLDLSDTFCELVQKRGRDVLPYITQNLRRIWFRGLRSMFGQSGNEKMASLALERGWLDLWAAIVRMTMKPAEYNREVRRLLDDSTLPDREVNRRLALLAGVSREFNFPGIGLAMQNPLEDATASRLYGRFPALLLGPFKAQVASSWGPAYPLLTAKAMAQNDEGLLDFLASRLVTRVSSYSLKDAGSVIETLSRYYEALRPEGADFSRRASEVLGQVPAFTIYDYKAMIDNNRLARLLFERSFSSYLADSRAVSNLVEAPEIHVQMLAYRILALDDERARALASENVEILMGTLLRPLYRRTRKAAFRALLNAASTEENGARILARAREACDLPDKRYPKEQLAGLIAGIIARWPSLRGDREKCLIYGE